METKKEVNAPKNRSGKNNITKDKDKVKDVVFGAELDAIELGLKIDFGRSISNTLPKGISEERLSEMQLEAARKLRQVLSTDRELVIQELVARNWVPLLLCWLRLHHRPTVQVEALWALTNLAAAGSDHAPLLLRHGAAPALVSLLGSQNPEVLEQAMWLLGNLAGEGPAARDAVLACQVLVPLVACLERCRDNLSLVRIGSWALSNLCDGQAEEEQRVQTRQKLQATLRTLEEKKRAFEAEVEGVRRHHRGCDWREYLEECGETMDYELQEIRAEFESIMALQDATARQANGTNANAQVRPSFDVEALLPCLGWLLGHGDPEVLSHACWALSHLCDGPPGHLRAVVQAGASRRLVQLLNHPAWRVAKPALRAIGNIVCAEDDTDHSQHIIEAGAVDYLRQLIAHDHREIQKEACWTLSNIAAGTVDQIQCVLDSGAIPYLIQLASDPGADPEVKSEACWVVLNATSCGSDVQIQYLVKEGCISVLGDLLSETSMVMMALEGLERILQVGDEEARQLGVNPYTSLLSVTRIEQLESHQSSAIAKRASRIWKQYFVTCAICGLAFGKNGPETKFCGECKCAVCQKCDCTVFHLSYQEELWKEVTSKEETQKEAQQALKRSKKQKKKKKLKEKKAAKQQEQRRLESQVNKHAQSRKQATPPATESPELQQADAKQRPLTMTMKRKARFKPGTSMDSRIPAGPECEDQNDEAESHFQQNGNLSVTNTVYKGKTKAKNRKKPFPQTKNGLVTASCKPVKSLRATMVTQAPLQDSAHSSTGENDDLVSFLQQTGSILALAELMDQEEDGIENFNGANLVKT